MSSEVQNLLDAALRAAQEAGRITLRYFQSDIAVEWKSDLSPVTIADRSAEEWIVEFIRREFPDHAILGEEFGEHPGASDYRWIIDPIDGTKSFVSGVPLYGTMVAIEDRRLRDAVVGVVHLAALGETVCAGRGLGASWNGRPTRVASTRLAEGILLTTDLAHVESRPDRKKFDQLRTHAKTFRMWGDCYGHVLVATGRATVMVDAKMSLWDVAALKPILEEAGGWITDWRGRRALDITEAISFGNSVAEDVLAILRGL